MEKVLEIIIRAVIDTIVLGISFVIAIGIVSIIKFCYKSIKKYWIEKKRINRRKNKRKKYSYWKVRKIK